MKITNKFELLYLNKLANLYLSLGFPIQAVNLLKKMVSRYPSEKEIYFLVAKSFKRLRKWNDSVDTLQAALTVFPADLEIHWALGMFLMDLGRPSGALEHLIFYLQHYRHDDKNVLANIYALLGSCYLSLANWEKAEEYLGQSRELAPWNLDACVSTIELYQVTGRSKRIMEFIDGYIASYPSLAPLYLWKGHYIQYILRQPKNSLDSYRQGLKNIIDPETKRYSESYYYTASIFDNLLDEYIDALFSSGDSVMIPFEIKKYEGYGLTTNMDTISRRIKYFTRIGNINEAEKIFLKSPKKIRETPEILTTNALTHFKKGEIDKAANTVAQVLLIDPELVDALDLLGLIQMHNGLWNDAVPTYKALLNKSPFTTNWLKNLGVCYYNLSKFEKTLECYEACVRYDEFDAETWIELGNLYEKSGKQASAISAYKNGLNFDWLSDEKRKQAIQAVNQLTSG